jgi:iron complex outermembrane receptor protein
VDNFTDAVVYANAQRSYTSGYNTYQFQPPRTFGVRVRYSF